MTNVRRIHSKDPYIERLRNQRDDLREALAGIRSRALMEMESEGFNQETDESWLLDTIDDALANLNKTDGE